MIYEIGSRGLRPIGAHNNDARNILEPGAVLQLNGYDNPRYCVLKNLGINKTFPDYGARYLVANIATGEQGYKDAYALKHISEKKDGRIQLYITDERLGQDTVIDLWQTSERKRKEGEEKKRKHEAEQKEKEAKGRELFGRRIPADAQALIVAEHHEDESDTQSDYFNHRTTKTVILGWSRHRRDLFSEMRKHAAKLPETEHMAPGMGHFEARVVASEDFESAGRYYGKGQRSHWHNELTEERGMPRVFKTRKEAEDFIARQKPLEPIHFEGRPIAFEWAIDEEKIEHREKWSMGAGYYLKDGGRNSTGWAVRKAKKYGAEWPAYLYILLAERCIF